MPLRNDLLNPIPGDNPAGENLRYDPVTDKIKEARREDLNVPQGEWKTALKTADYPLVIKLGSDALAKRGKDLQIAVWLVDAHVRKEGLPVLAPAFQFLRDLLEQYWDTLYPPIEEDGDMEVRAAPLVWLGSILKLPEKGGESLGFLPIVGKLSWQKYQESRTVGYESSADTSQKQDARSTAVAENKMTAEEFDEVADNTSIASLRETYKQLNAAIAAVDSLAEYCDTQFLDASPSFVKTREAIEEIAQTVRIILSRKPGGLEEEPSEEGTSGETQEETSFDDSFSVEATADSDGSGQDEDSGSFNAGGDRASIGRQLAVLCKSLRALDPNDPSPYLMLRTFVWGPLMNNAPLINRSLIAAPEGDLRVRLKRLAADGEWDQILDITENAMLQPYGGYWLDLQRYTISAIEQKGYPANALTVTNHVRVLLEILPDLRELTLPDDTPAGNQETQNWLDNNVLRKAMPGFKPIPPGTQEESSSSDSFSLDTPSTDDSSFSFDTPTEDTTSFDTSSSEYTPEADASAEPAPEPEPYTVEENPPILEAEEPPPCDTSDEFGMALQAVRDGQTAEGLAMITSILATERSGRARFRRRTQLAHLLMAAGKGKVAQPLLDQIAAEIEERKLEEWEPGEAIAYPLELLLHCLTSADDERRAQLYTRICKLDPVRAVNCSF